MTRYATVHKQLSRKRGRAVQHPCSHCPGQASEWAYAGGDPDELVEVRLPFGGPPQPVRYSRDVTRYIPLCTPCHRRLDGQAVSYSRVSEVDLRKPKERTGIRQRCRCCQMTKDSGAFSLDRHRKVGRQSWCRACNARYQADRKATRWAARLRKQGSRR